VFASKTGVAKHGIQIRLGQAARLSHAIALHDVFDNGDDRVFGQARCEKEGAAMLGKLLFVDQTPEKASLLMGTVPNSIGKITLCLFSLDVLFLILYSSFLFPSIVFSRT
jgi:hypothetical protein